MQRHIISFNSEHVRSSLKPENIRVNLMKWKCTRKIENKCVLRIMLNAVQLNSPFQIWVWCIFVHISEIFKTSVSYRIFKNDNLKIVSVCCEFTNVIL